MVTQQGMVPVAVKIIQYKQGKSVAASKAEVAREVQILKLMWQAILAAASQPRVAICRGAICRGAIGSHSE